MVFGSPFAEYLVAIPGTPVGKIRYRPPNYAHINFTQNKNLNKLWIFNVFYSLRDSHLPC